MLASRERRETSVALTSTLHWFETEVLTEEDNYQGLARLNTDVVQREAMRRPTRRVILGAIDVESPVHGAQEQSAYNGHFESVCYHPLFVFNQEGDCPLPARAAGTPAVVMEKTVPEVEDRKCRRYHTPGRVSTCGKDQQDLHRDLPPSGPLWVFEIEYVPVAPAMRSGLIGGLAATSQLMPIHTSGRRR
jgi:hypothetical protein